MLTSKPPDLGGRELDLAVNTPRSAGERNRGYLSQDCWWQNHTFNQQVKETQTYSVSSHNDFDVFCWLKSIELDSTALTWFSAPLNLPSTTSTLPSTASNRINLIHEDNTRRMFPSHDKQLPHHPTTLSNILLYQLQPRYSNWNLQSVSDVRPHRANNVLPVPGGP